MAVQARWGVRFYSLYLGLLLASAAHAAEAPETARRIDPLLRHELRAIGSDHTGRGLALAPRVASAAAPVYACWVRMEPGTPLPADIPLRRQGAGIASGRLHADEIERLASIPGVVAIEAARRCRSYLDESVPEIGADQVHQGAGIPPIYSGFTGENVVVGIVDTGIDLEHEDFIEANATRILSLWDQTAPSVNPPSGFGYGREWSPAEIDGGSSTQVDTEGHGTHVAGTAAGSGAATGNGEPAYQYVGVAPKADLVIVKTDFYTSSIIDAVEYVFAQAADLGRPAVVNLSLGHQYGPHDGTDATDLAIDALVGPGRIVVAAAGNEQQDGIHAETSVAAGGNEEIRFDIPAYSPFPGASNDVVLIDGYYSQTTAVEVTVITPNGHTIGPVSPSSQEELHTADGAVLVENDVYDPPTADRNVHIQIWDQVSGSPPEPGEWRVILENVSLEPGAANSQVDFWIYNHSLPSGPSFDVAWGRTAAKLVGSPASADSAIAVGAYVTRASWHSVDGNMYSYNPIPQIGSIAPFSSRGPRRDGVVKPDISAPGMGIGAALSADHAVADAWILEDGVHFITQGTSMACPHVAGVVALLFEAYGPLSRAEIMNKLSETARADGFTGGLPNSTFGAGKIDALAALTEPTPVLLLGLDVVREADGVHLIWSVPESLQSAWFLVERSFSDGGDGEEVERTELGVVGPGPEYRFVDEAAPRDAESFYWLTAIDEPDFALGPFAAPAGSRPARLVLSRPAPNPFSTAVQWSVTLPEAGPLRVALLDAGGRRIATLAEGWHPAGTTIYSWDGRSDEDRTAGSGVYWIRCLWNGMEETARVLLVR